MPCDDFKSQRSRSRYDFAWDWCASCLSHCSTHEYYEISGGPAFVDGHGNTLTIEMRVRFRARHKPAWITEPARVIGASGSGFYAKIVDANGRFYECPTTDILVLK